MLFQTLKYSSLIIYILFLSTSISISQVNTVVINEQFNDNSNYWDVHDEPQSMLNMLNGKYYMEGKMLGRAITSTISTPVTENDNFKISVELTKLNGIDDNGFGLIWGGKDENNEYEFVISGNGQFKVIEWRNGIKKDLIAWTFFSDIQKWDNAKNRLRIEKRGETIKFYINDNYVAVVHSAENMGNRIGFVINETMEVEFNYLIYEKIEKQSTAVQQTDQVNITDVNFTGSSEQPELKYGESTVLKIKLENNADFQVTDLALMISSSDIGHAIEYNPITMIEMIPAHDQAIISVSFAADEEVETMNHNFSIMLMDGKNNTLDSKKVSLKTIGRSNYYTENNNSNSNSYKNNSKSDDYKYKKSNNNSSDGCTKGCAYATLGALLVGLILAIIP
ncbi:MAG: hypothetical protein DRI95_00255 [Bacteroidetes bacterium]|nr:MAG: hypothetical protein DRI95_00255 [Bacteroidota bacterium]